MRFLYLAFVALVAAFCAMMAVRAEAHSWYEMIPCCHDRDCGPVANGTVIGGPNGYSVQFPGYPAQIVPYNSPKIRTIPADAPAEDRGVFHVCTRGGRPDGEVLCIYPPDGGT